MPNSSCDDLGKRGQAVGGARGVGIDRCTSVFGVVDTHDVHGSIGGGSRDDDLLGTSLEMHAGLLSGGEDTSGLADNVDASLTPWNGGGVTLGEEVNLGPSDNEAAISDRHFSGVVYREQSRT